MKKKKKLNFFVSSSAGFSFCLLVVLNNLCQAHHHNHVISLSHPGDLLSAPPQRELSLLLPSPYNTHLCPNSTQPRLQMQREKIISEKMFIRNQLGSIFLNISTSPSKHTNNSFIDRTQSQHPITVRFALPQGRTLLSSPEPVGSSQAVLAGQGSGYQVQEAVNTFITADSSALLWLPTCQAVGDPGEVDTNRSEESVFI